MNQGLVCNNEGIATICSGKEGVETKCKDPDILVFPCSYTQVM